MEIFELAEGFRPSLCVFGTPFLRSQEDKMSVCITEKLFSHTGKDRSHFNQAPHFSWMDYETCVTVTSADIRATEHLVSISLGMVFSVAMASTPVSCVN